MNHGKRCMELFLTFLRIGLFTFGGGHAMIPLIEDACVEKKQWITRDEMTEATVIAESTPGPVAINCAAFVGYKQARLPGALAATFGVVLPSFLIILLISLFFDRFLSVGWVANAFRGVKLAVGLLIVRAAIRMLKTVRWNPMHIAIAVCTFGAMLAINYFALRFSTVYLILIAAFAGVVLYAVSGRKAREGGADG